MYRILVVDNEHRIVDGLVQTLGSADLQLEVYGAYSAKQALEWLERTKMDIVLTDIRMPGMTGLELQHHIKAIWPRCKVIFMSGYNEFDYIQQAIRQGSVDYVLKAEGNQAIVRSVVQAIGQIRSELETSDMLHKARLQLNRTIELLQRDFFRDLIEGDKSAFRVLKNQFEELALPLSSGRRVLMLLGRVDEWNESFSRYDKALLIYAVQNIVKEYLGGQAVWGFTQLDTSKFVWFLQPTGIGQAPEPDEEALWTALDRFVFGTLESVQQTCKELLHVNLSFVLAREAVNWADVPVEFDRLRLKLSLGLGMGHELLLRDFPEPAEVERSDSAHHPVSAGMKRIEALRRSLESGHKAEFFLDYGELMQWVQAAGKPQIQLAVYAGLVSLFLSLAHEQDFPVWLEQTDLDRMARYDRQGKWGDVCEYFSRMAEQWFERQSKGQKFQENQLVARINHHIQEHIAGDLSLTRISELTGYNATYMSKLYKQKTGQSVSEMITRTRLDKAKRLLGDPEVRIADVSKAVGFVSENHFYYFFRKAAQMTPKEYRDRALGINS